MSFSGSLLSVSGTGIQQPQQLDDTDLDHVPTSALALDLKHCHSGTSTPSSERYSLLGLNGEGVPKGKKMERAKTWSPEVEDLYRLQFCGWRDEAEYTKVYGEPDRWQPNKEGHCFISKVQLKSNGYFTYWRKYRECDDRHIYKVKIFS
mmetsp:Transcript_12906/g.30206  ORF Transcript_12906/g.30206 Transcript_12906/m.30206 type:complete len:149 (+) Transcript_12906:82-528(+)|eukprot:CAMPEP_0178430586 /NCGR_PEP_ID=MMETSP0689_2-20121128/31400_1 /TAXON_ID=160604 /ORGANISM="Amphidinium massartii, Strain CS-259" /LENGTH=148 /DNA_ID=CAMNT_0020052455 /DNA_START=82 /DNA_END=528 /DNA_ORIENTATION=+